MATSKHSYVIQRIFDASGDSRVFQTFFQDWDNAIVVQDFVDSRRRFERCLCCSDSAHPRHEPIGG